MQAIRVLRDVDKRGKEINWRGHKEDSLLLGDSYRRLGEWSKAGRVSVCSGFVQFNGREDGTKRLVSANFCQCRLCPMCAWRRSLKIFRQASKVMDYVAREKNKRYLFLTLTVKNVPGGELSGAIDGLFAAYKKMAERKEFRKIAKGTFRCLEVTHKRDGGDDYHPHMHVIIAVNPSYFSRSGGSGYLSHKTWMGLWGDCAGLDYDPWVYIEAVKPKEGEKSGGMGYGKAVAEVAKYTVKAGDFLVRPPREGSEWYERLKKEAERQTDEAVAVLDKALANRRLVAFAGLMRGAHKALNLGKPDGGNLVDTDNEVDDGIRDDLWSVVETYRWCPGYRNYVLETWDGEDGE